MPKPPVRKPKKKVCAFCKENAQPIDYKDTTLLRRFISDRGKIRARRTTGNCTQHQADVAVAIKTARELALLPYTQRTVTERGPGRPPRSDRGEGRRRDDGETPDLPDLVDREDVETDDENGDDYTADLAAAGADLDED